MVNKVSTAGKVEPSMSATSSHPISSIAQTSISSIPMTTSITSVSSVTYSHLPPISIPSTVPSSMLPALTPGPSPTALTVTEGIPTTTKSSISTTSTAVTSAGADNEYGHHFSTVSMPATTKKSVAFAQQNNNSNNSSGNGGAVSGSVSGSGTSVQSRALPLPPNC